MLKKLGIIALLLLLCGVTQMEIIEASASLSVSIEVTDESLDNATNLNNFKNMGVNFEMSKTSDEMWNSNGNWMEHTYANSGIKMIRWGYDAWVYDWEEEIPLNTNYQGGMNTKDADGSFGLREFIRFSKKHDIIPFIHIPIESWKHNNGKSDPTYRKILQLATNMAVYLKQNGIDKAYFDMGNEPMEAPSCPYGTLSAATYGSTFKDFYTAIKAVNQDYKIVMMANNTIWYQNVKQAASENGIHFFDAVDYHNYPGNNVGWNGTNGSNGYYQRNDDNIFANFDISDVGIEKIMGECNIPWPNFPTYSTSLGSAMALINGFLDLANDDQYSSIIMWPSQWPSNDTTTNAFNTSGKSFGWFDQDGWYQNKETKRFNGPIYAEMIVQNNVLSKKVSSISSDEKIRTFAYTDDLKKELNLFVVNKRNSDMQFQLNVPSQYNRVKAVVLRGDKDIDGFANTDETPEYHGHISNQQVTNGDFQDIVTYGECVVVYTFYTDTSISSPENFQVLYPENNSNNISTAVNFTWENSKNATDYFFILSQNADLSNPIIETTTAGNTNFQLPNDLKNSTNYFWKVSALNANGVTESLGKVQAFKTIIERHFVDNNDSSIIYTGAWNLNQRYLGSFGGTDSGSATAGDSMTIEFDGTRAILYGIKDNWIRKVAISVDGGESVIYDLYENRGVMEYSIDDLAHYSRGTRETEAQKKERLNNCRPTQQVIFDSGILSDENENHIITVTLLNDWNDNVTASWKGFEFDYYEVIKKNDPTHVTTASKPNFIKNLPETKTVIRGDELNLSVSIKSQDNGSLSYEWYKDDILLENYTEDSIQISNISESDSGIYYVRVTNWNQNGTSKTDKSLECNISVVDNTSNKNTLTYENIRLFEDSSFDISNERDFFQGLNGLGLTILFKVNEGQQDNRMSLFTLSNGNGEYITVWITPNSGKGNGQISIAHNGSSPGLVWTRSAAFINDTLWHKLTMSIIDSSMNVALDGINAGHNGKLSITDQSHFSYINNFFLKKNNVTWKDSIEKIIIGGYDRDATYAMVSNREIQTFQGDIKYVKISKIAASEDEILEYNVNSDENASLALSSLLSQDLGDGSRYTATTWNAYLSAKNIASSLDESSMEQVLWNAHDNLIATMNQLREVTNMNLLHSTLNEYNMDGSQQILVDKKHDGNQYLAHPDMVMIQKDVIENGVLISGKGRLVTAYTVGHGVGQIRLKASDTRGLTWSEILPTPSSWSYSEETPTMYELKLQDGEVKYIEISGAPVVAGWSVLGGWQTSISLDGIHWSEYTRWFGNNNYHSTIDSIVAMASLVHLKDSYGNYIDKWMGVFHDSSFRNYKSYLTFTEDGIEQWTEPTRLLEKYGDVEQFNQMCEIRIIRSPEEYDGGSTLALLARNQSHNGLSTISFSTDEGMTWTLPRYMPASLYGERHKTAYDPLSGRLIVTFREMSLDLDRDGIIEQGDWIAGDWVAWVGTFEDLLNGNEGEYRIRLAEDYTNTTFSGDCGYAGIEVYEDGLFVLDSYGKWDSNGDNTAYKGAYIIAIRFLLSDIDDAIYHDIDRVSLRNQTELSEHQISMLSESDYSTEAWSSFETAICNANKILEKNWEESSQTEIDAATQTLRVTFLK